MLQPHQIGYIFGSTIQLHALCSSFVFHFCSMQCTQSRGEFLLKWCKKKFALSSRNIHTPQKQKTGLIIHSISVDDIDVRLKRSVIASNVPFKVLFIKINWRNFQIENFSLLLLQEEQTMTAAGYFTIDKPMLFAVSLPIQLKLSSILFINRIQVSLGIFAYVLLVIQLKTSEISQGAALRIRFEITNTHQGQANIWMDEKMLRMTQRPRKQIHTTKKPNEKWIILHNVCKQKKL